MTHPCDAFVHAGAVRAVMGGVDCHLQTFVQNGYLTLVGGETFQRGLTVLLTLFVASIGYRLLWAPEGVRVSEGPKAALKIGIVLALTANWALFDRLVVQVATRGPIEIFQALSSGTAQERRDTVDPVGRLQVAFDQLSTDAEAFANPQPKTAFPAQSAPQPINPAQPPAPLSLPPAAQGKAMIAATSLSIGAAVLLLFQAGFISALTLMLDLICAVGPIFILLLLFRETRSFFQSWVRSIATLCLAIAGAWTIASLLTTVLDPWLVELARTRDAEDLSPDPAMTASVIVLVFALVQMANIGLSILIGFGVKADFSRLAMPGAGLDRAVGALRSVDAPSAARSGQLADHLQRTFARGGAEGSRDSRPDMGSARLSYSLERSSLAGTTGSLSPKAPRSELSRFKTDRGAPA